MFKSWYEKSVLNYPVRTFFLMILCVVLLGIHAYKVEVDASADTLLLEHDKDLQYNRLINKRYKNPDFLLIAFSVHDDLLSSKNLDTIAKLSFDLEQLPRVEKVTSILNVPLLLSPAQELQNLVNNVPTLSNSKPDKALVKQEFLTSPLYKNALVSDDFKTTSIIVNLKTDAKYFELIAAKEELQERKKLYSLSQAEEKKLGDILVEYKQYKEVQREIEHQNIEDIRLIMRKYQNDGELFLGGVNMIVDDIITYVKNDLLIYGSTLLLILIIVLWIIFKELKWIVLPIFICTLSVVSTTGILGLFDWQVTVISSNFISLQLVITLSIVLHLIVRYNELNQAFPDATQKELVLETVLSKLKPSFFAIVTTIAGFSSLVVSDIKPVINLGLMMSIGIAISLIIAFIIFPTSMMMLKKAKMNPMSAKHFFSMTKLCSNTVLNYGNTIIIVSLLVFVFSLWASSKLIVENSFISYFKKTTPIYQGMEVIDQKLGGTTPLDIIIDFKAIQEESTDLNTHEEFLDSFEDEFLETQDKPEYWFTPNKMQIITKVHNYLESLDEIGNVQSLATLLKIGKELNNNKELDSILLALLYNKLPNEYKKIILSPYISIENDQARINTRIIDSNEELRRNELLNKIKLDLATLLQEDDVDFHLTNLMVLYNNMLQSLFDSQIATLGIVLMILLLMFLILFKSLKVALIALIVNIIPVSVVFGLMGIANIPLNIMTITIAAICIGIGVDDTIHYIHRFKEEYFKCGNYIVAMKESHSSIGYAMYYTSLAIILGFSILVVSNFIPTIYFGLLTVIVMFIVLLADLLLLPKLLLVFKPFK
ncbi:MAG: MMPL family transporter [Sulfurimonadaceae bacterium]